MSGGVRSPDGDGGLRWWIATGLGTGLAPVASGTFGSLPGLAASWALWSWGGLPAQAAGTLAVAVLGFWAAGPVARSAGQRDPGIVVIDEVAGQMVALLMLAASGWTLVASFLLFRLFDVIKPFPAGRAEALPGASGIMTDDLIAGLYANLALRLGLWVMG